MSLDSFWATYKDKTHFFSFTNSFDACDVRLSSFENFSSVTEESFAEALIEQSIAYQSILVVRHINYYLSCFWGNTLIQVHMGSGTMCKNGIISDITHCS